MTFSFFLVDEKHPAALGVPMHENWCDELPQRECGKTASAGRNDDAAKPGAGATNRAGSGRRRIEVRARRATRRPADVLLRTPILKQAS